MGRNPVDLAAGFYNVNTVPGKKSRIKVFRNINQIMLYKIFKNRVPVLVFNKILFPGLLLEPLHPVCEGSQKEAGIKRILGPHPHSTR